MVLAISLSAITSCFAREEISCPATIRLASGSIESEDLPAGFKPTISDSIERLSGGSVFYGPPDQDGAVKLTSTSSSSARSKWVFDEGAENEIWISCDYAKSGLVKLAKQVKKPIASCSMISRKIKPTGIIDIKFSCE